LPVMRFAVVYTEKRAEAKEAAWRAKQLLESRGIEVEVHSAQKLVGEKLPNDINLVVALGGDGTILKTVGALSGSETPILGINFGRGGFLTEVEADMLEEALEKVVKGDYEVERIGLLRAEAGEAELGDVLNEVYVVSGKTGKLLKAEIAKAGSKLLEVEADGLIISTPIGSTAYSYSAGGPVVDDELDAVIITAVCPISSFRSMVLPLSRKISVDLKSEHGFSILLDGFIEKKLANRSLHIELRKSSKQASFVRLGLGESFARRLRKKLG